MKMYKELTIVMPNKPGKLAQALRAMARAKINLIAVDASSGYDLNMVRLVTSDPQNTRKKLENLGYNVTEAIVLAITISDKPGQLAQIASAFAGARVNINYIYASAVAYDQPAMVVVNVADLARAEKALRAAKIN